jgi:hypothetical protein
MPIGQVVTGASQVTKNVTGKLAVTESSIVSITATRISAGASTPKLVSLHSSAVLTVQRIKALVTPKLISVAHSSVLTVQTVKRTAANVPKLISIAQPVRFTVQAAKVVGASTSKLISFLNSGGGASSTGGDFNKDFSSDFSTGTATIPSMTISIIPAKFTGIPNVRQLLLYSGEVLTVQRIRALVTQRQLSIATSEIFQAIRKLPKLISFTNAGASGTSSTGGDFNKDFSSDFSTGTATTVIPSMAVSIIYAKLTGTSTIKQLLIQSREVLTVQRIIASVTQRQLSIATSEILQTARMLARQKQVSITETSVLTIRAIKVVLSKLISFTNAGSAGGSVVDFSSIDFNSADFMVDTAGGDFNKDFSSDFSTGTVTTAIPSMTVSVVSQKFIGGMTAKLISIYSNETIRIAKGLAKLSSVFETSIATVQTFKSNIALRSTLSTYSTLTGANFVTKNVTGKLSIKSAQLVTGIKLSTKKIPVVVNPISVVLAVTRSLRRTILFSVHESVTRLSSPSLTRLFSSPEKVTRTAIVSKTTVLTSSQVISFIRYISRILPYAISVLLVVIRGPSKPFLFKVGESVTKGTSPVRVVLFSTLEIITRRISLLKFVNVSSSSLVSLIKYVSRSISVTIGQVIKFFKSLRSKIIFSISSIVTELAPIYKYQASFVTNNLLTAKGYMTLRLMRTVQTGSLLVVSAVKGLHTLPVAIIQVFSSQVVSYASYVSKNVVIINSENFRFTKSLIVVRNFLSQETISSIKFSGRLSAFSMVQSLSISKNPYKIFGIVLSELMGITRAIPARVGVVLSQHLGITRVRQVVSTFFVSATATTSKVTNKIILLYTRVTKPKQYDLVFSYISKEAVTVRTALFKFIAPIVATMSSALSLVLFFQRGRVFPVLSSQIISTTRVSSFFRTLALTVSEAISIIRVPSSSINFATRESIIYIRVLNRLTLITSSISMLLTRARLSYFPQFLFGSSEVLSVLRIYIKTPSLITGQVFLIAKALPGSILVITNQIISTGKIIARIILDFSSEIVATTTSIQFTSFQNLVSMGQTLSLVAKQPAAQFRLVIQHSQLWKATERAVKIIQITSVSTFTSTKMIFKSSFSFSLSVVSSIIRSYTKIFGLVTNQPVKLIKLFYRIFNIQSVEQLRLVKSSIKVFSYITNEVTTSTNLIVKYITLISSYRLDFTKATNKLFSFITRPVMSFSRVGSKYFAFIQSSRTTVFRPAVYKVFNLSTVENVLIVVRTSHLVLFASSQLYSFTVVISKTLKVTIHELLQFVRTSKGKLFIDIDQTLDLIKSANWRTLVRTPERLTLSRVASKIIGFQEQIITISRSFTSRVLRIVTIVPITLTRVTNRSLGIRFIERISLAKALQKTIRISIHEIVKSLIGKPVIFTQHMLSSLRRTMLKPVRIVTDVHLAYVISTRKAKSIIVRSAQLFMLGKAVLKHIRITVSEKLSRNVTYYFVRVFYSPQKITRSFGYHKSVAIHWFETLFVSKTSLKSIRVRITSRLTVPRTTLKRIGFVVRNKVQQGIIYHRAMSWVTPVIATASTRYGKTFIIVQDSVISVFRKVRSLIQRAVILLTGA